MKNCNSYAAAKAKVVDPSTRQSLYAAAKALSEEPTLHTEANSSSVLHRSELDEKYAKMAADRLSHWNR